MATIDVVVQGYNYGSDQGRFGFSGIYLVRGRRNILVDTSHVGRRENLLQGLERLQLRLSDIDLVVLTHAHWDHMLNVDLFKDTPIMLSRTELDYAHAPHAEDWATPGYAGAILDRHKVQTVGEGQEIDDGVWVMETPGHTWGSVTVAVQLSDGVAGIVGDAVPNAVSAVRRVPYLIFGTESDARASAEKILNGCRLLYPGHDRPFEVDGQATRYVEGFEHAMTVRGTAGPNEMDMSVTLAAPVTRGLWAFPHAHAPTAAHTH
jgi:glyoxylase-like metal-dependent hydrolase (beta-lactamase superfamily II)